MRIRTVRQAIKELKEEDPKCALTQNALLKMVKSGEIPHVKNANMYLVDLDLIKTRFEKGVC